ncbi:MAG: polysaccharide biosynthesis/export family protein [Endomicrobiales bacterium]
MHYTISFKALIITLLTVSLGISQAPAQAGSAGDGQGPGAGIGAPQEGEDPYVLGSDDVLRIYVENHPEWSGDFIVKPEGTVLLKDIGEIKVEGLTKEELRAALVKQLGRYINNPQITVDTVQYKSQTITVLGEVNRPGEYPTQGKQVTLKDAIIMAGLPSRFAATGRVFVITPDKHRPRQKVVNAYRILYRGETKNNIVIKPGDIVYVPQTLLGKLNEFISAILSPWNSVAVTSAGL